MTESVPTRNILVAVLEAPHPGCSRRRCTLFGLGCSFARSEHRDLFADLKPEEGAAASSSVARPAPAHCCPPIRFVRPTAAPSRAPSTPAWRMGPTATAGPPERTLPRTESWARRAVPLSAIPNRGRPVEGLTQSRFGVKGERWRLSTFDATHFNLDIGG